MSKIHRTREVFKVKNNLYKAAPKILDIDVDIKELKNGRYQARVQTFLPGKKTVVAVKTGSNFNKALTKAQYASLRQIKKVLEANKRRYSIKDLMLEKAA